MAGTADLGDSADKHWKEIQALKAVHGKHVRDMDGMKVTHAHYATVEQRVDYVEEPLLCGQASIASSQCCS